MQGPTINFTRKSDRQLKTLKIHSTFHNIDFANILTTLMLKIEFKSKNPLR